MRSKSIIYLLFIMWVAVFAGSILMTLNIEGPRNLDTGLARLDVLVRGQLIAGVLAIAAAIMAFVVGSSGWTQRAIGLAPLALTAILIAGLFIFASLRPDEPVAPADPVSLPPPTETAPSQ